MSTRDILLPPLLRWTDRTPLLRPLALIISDAAALALALAIAVASKGLSHRGVPLVPYLRLWPFAIVFLGSYWMSGLYSRPALSQPEDLKRGTACSFCIFLSLSAFTLALRGGSSFLTLTLAICIVANAILMPLLRELSRHLFAGLPGWGYQAVIFGAGPEALALIERSRRERDLGISPVAIVDPADTRRFLAGIPIVSSIQSAAAILDLSMPAYGLLTLAAASSIELVRLANSSDSVIFSRVVLISHPAVMSSLWALPQGRRHMLNLNTKPRTDCLTYHLAKRLLDLSLAVLTLLACAPSMALIAICIKLDSAGPVFFGHNRLGRNGRQFKAWKFRTMYAEGQAILEQWLAENSSAKEEWAANGKLMHDPRVTRVGRLLRVTSTDELPQLWNVLRGDMSLVGPRPIVQDEVRRYGEDYGFHSQAHAGVTGLWQVCGRSTTTYSERVMLDSFYVQNWSIWLDLTIILRTFGAVLLRKGAV